MLKKTAGLSEVLQGGQGCAFHSSAHVTRRHSKCGRSSSSRASLGKRAGTAPEDTEPATRELGGMHKPLLHCKVEKIPPHLLSGVTVTMQIKDRWKLGRGRWRVQF